LADVKSQVFERDVPVVEKAASWCNQLQWLLAHGDDFCTIDLKGVDSTTSIRCLRQIVPSLNIHCICF